MTREPDETAGPMRWATRLSEFVAEAARIAKEDLADKEVTFDDTMKRAEELIRKQPLTAVGLVSPRAVGTRSGT